MRLLIVAGLVVASAVSGCRQEPPPRPPAATRPALVGPRRTIEQLLSLRAARRYREMSAWGEPPNSARLGEFVAAVDDFLAANTRLCDWLRDHVGAGAAETVDQAYVAGNLTVYVGDDLGVFSRGVELLDEVVSGDQATVSYSVPARPAAGRANLRRQDGAWRLDPGPFLNAEVPAAFAELARGLEQAARELKSGHPSAGELRRNPDRLARRVESALRRGVDRLSRAASSAPASSRPTTSP